MLAGFIVALCLLGAFGVYAIVRGGDVDVD